MRKKTRLDRRETELTNHIMKKIIIKNIIVLLLISAVFLAAAGCSLISGVTGGVFDKPLVRDDGTDANVYVIGGKPLDPSESVTAAPSGPSIPGFDPYSLIGKAEWPDNEFTKQVPEPPFSLLTASEDDGTFTAAFRNVTDGQIRDYVEKVKAAGFTEDPELQDETVMGIAIYSYTASNAAGYTVTVALSSGMGSISISK